MSTAAPIPDNGYTLLTGATGLLGRYLMRDLLRAGVPLAVLVRPTRGATPQARVAALTQGWWHGAAPVVLAGDVATPGLGLDAADTAWVARHCDRVLHNAAVVQFQGRSPEGEPWRTNVRGTKGVLELCHRLQIDDLHYVSTAYVSGDRTGQVTESEFDEGQAFRNDYEESKFRAERSVREDGGIRHRTIYRPGVIAGDAHTGHTTTYHGFYVYLRGLSLVVPRLRPGPDGIRRIPYDLPLDEPRNIVPVDWVSRVMVHLLGQSDVRNHTIHLTPTHPVTPRQVIDFTASFYGGGRVELCRPLERVGAIQNLARATRMLRSYESYGGTEAHFGTENLQRFAGQLPCPLMDEAMVHRYLAFAEHDRWGRGCVATS